MLTKINYFDPLPHDIEDYDPYGGEVTTVYDLFSYKRDRKEFQKRDYEESFSFVHPDDDYTETLFKIYESEKNTQLIVANMVKDISQIEQNYRMIIENIAENDLIYTMDNNLDAQVQLGKDISAQVMTLEKDFNSAVIALKAQNAQIKNIGSASQYVVSIKTTDKVTDVQNKVSLCVLTFSALQT